MAAGAVIAAAGAARALDDLLFAFRGADATAPARALPLSEIGIEPSMALSRLERAGVVKSGADSTCRYLNERALRAYRERQRSRSIVVALLGVFVLLAVGVFALVTAHR